MELCVAVPRRRACPALRSHNNGHPITNPPIASHPHHRPHPPSAKTDPKKPRNPRDQRPRPDQIQDRTADLPQAQAQDHAQETTTNRTDRTKRTNERLATREGLAVLSSPLPSSLSPSRACPLLAAAPQYYRALHWPSLTDRPPITFHWPSHLPILASATLPASQPAS